MSDEIKRLGAEMGLPLNSSSSDVFREALRVAKEAVANMTADERSAMHCAQSRSFVLAEAGFGSDADEAAYAEALRAGGTERLAALDAEAADRVRQAEAILDRSGL